MMKKNRLLIVMMLFIAVVSFVLTGCETGTRYDKNTSIKTAPKHDAKSGLVNHDDIEALLEDEGELEDEMVDERSWIDIDSDVEAPEEVEDVDIDEVAESYLNSVVVHNGLDVVKIREGRHEGYVRLVFDVYAHGKPAQRVGQYEAYYVPSKQDIVVTLYGYEKFSAPLPSFPHNSVIEQIYFEQYPANKGFKFHIKLREEAKVRIFDLENPARLVFDIKPI
jgi:hypothetical protein